MITMWVLVAVVQFYADQKQLVVTTIRDYLNKLARNSSAPTIPIPTVPSENSHPVCSVSEFYIVC